MSITKSSTFTDPLLPFQLTNVLNDKGNQSQKFFGHLAHFLFFEGGCYVVQSQNLYYQKNTLHNYPSLMKTRLLLHCTHHTFAMLLSIWHLKQDVAISPESLSTCLTKTGKNLSSSYWFYLLLINESTITPFQVASNLLCNCSSQDMCCLRATTSVFDHYFGIWKHVPEQFNIVICSTQREVVLNQKTRKEQLSFQYFLVKVCSR